MSAPQKIAVAGATGRVGRHIVDVLTEHGHAVVPMSRATGVDIVTGDGLAAALDGVDCIVDAATGPDAAQDAATAFFTRAARNLQEAGRNAGAQRVIVVSIIGIDRITSGYAAAKNAHEQALRAGPLPVQVLRAAQFHEFVAQLVDWGTRGDVAYMPRMRTQLVAARSVAEALAELVRDPTTAVVEVAGPRAEWLADAATLLAARRGHPSKVEEGKDPSDPDADRYENGVLLPGPDAVVTGPTFEDWLESHHPV